MEGGRIIHIHCDVLEYIRDYEGSGAHPVDNRHIERSAYPAVAVVHLYT